jgi:hypothetical protein
MPDGFYALDRLGYKQAYPGTYNVEDKYSGKSKNVKYAVIRNIFDKNS